MAVLSKKPRKASDVIERVFCRKGDARSDVEKKNGKISVIFSSSFPNKIKRLSASVFCPSRCDIVLCEEQLLFVVWQGTVGKVTRHITCVPAHSSVNLCASPLAAREESLLTRNYVRRWNKGTGSKHTLGSLEDFHCQDVLLSLRVQSTSEAGTTSSIFELTVKQTPVQKRSLCTVWLHFFVMFISQWQTLFTCDSTRFSWPQCPDSSSPPPLFFFTSGQK